MEGVGGLHGWQWIVSLPFATLCFTNAIFIQFCLEGLCMSYSLSSFGSLSLKHDFSDDYHSHCFLLLYA